MGDAGFKGTSAEQDSRFSNKQKKLLKSMKFPPEFDQKVNMSKVNLEVIKPWISSEVDKLLGVEDEILIDYTMSLLEEKNPDPKTMQINLTGFLENKTQPFLRELWKLLISAQESVGGVPKVLLEQKKAELLEKQMKEKERKVEQDSVADVIRRKKQEEMIDLQADTVTRERRSRFNDISPPRQHSSDRSLTPPRHRSRSRERRSDRYDRDNRREHTYGRRSRRRSRDDGNSERARYRDSRYHSRGYHRSSSRSRERGSSRRRYRDSSSPRRHSSSSSRDDSRERKRRRSSRDDK